MNEKIPAVVNTNESLISVSSIEELERIILPIFEQQLKKSPDFGNIIYKKRSDGGYDVTILGETGDLVENSPEKEKEERVTMLTLPNAEILKWFDLEGSVYIYNPNASTGGENPWVLRDDRTPVSVPDKLNHLIDKSAGLKLGAAFRIDNEYWLRAPVEGKSFVSKLKLKGGYSENQLERFTPNPQRFQEIITAEKVKDYNYETKVLKCDYSELCAYIEPVPGATTYLWTKANPTVDYTWVGPKPSHEMNPSMLRPDVRSRNRIGNEYISFDGKNFLMYQCDGDFTDSFGRSYENTSIVEARIRPEFKDSVKLDKL